ncbi:hypothetical protein [Massilia sp. X63]
MTYRVKVNNSTGPILYYAIGAIALDNLLERLYAAGPIGVVLETLK